MSFKHLLLVFLSSLILSFVLYGNTIKGDFVYDDSFFSGRQELHDPRYLGKIWFESLRPGEPKAETYRPLTVLTLSLNFILFGSSTTSFHVVNIVLNAIVVFLVYLVSYQLFKNRNLAVFTALIFAFLPIHTEAVANIKSRDDILYSIFILLSLLTFLKGVVEKINFKLVFLASFYLFLAYFSKEFAVIAPILLLSLFIVLKSPKFRDLIKVGLVLTPFWIIYILVRYSVLGKTAFGDDNPFWYYIPTYHYPLVERVSTAFKILYLYVQKTFVPYNLSATHHFNHLVPIINPFTSPEGIAGIIIFVVLIVLILHKKTRKTPIGIGALIFFITYFIFSKFIFKSGEILAERWMYLPSFGLSLMAGYLFSLLSKYQKYMAVAVLAVILSLYGVIVFNRNKAWLTEKALYESMIKDAPDSTQGYIGLAYIYFYKDDSRRASYYLEKGKKIYSDHPRLLNLEAVISLGKKDYKMAEESIKKSIGLLPTPVSYMMYAIILTEQKKYEESLMITKQYMDSSFYKDERNGGMNMTADYLTAVDLKGLGREQEAKNYFDLDKPFVGASPLLP